jgi:hypothetical protein
MSDLLKLRRSAGTRTALDVLRNLFRQPARAVGRNPVLAGILGLFAVVLVYCGTTTNRTFDSTTYLHFQLFGARLWTVPFAFTVLGADPVRVAVQTALSIAAWSALIWVFAADLATKWLGWVLAIGILAVALTGQVRQWNVLILSESIFISLVLLLIAAALAYVRNLTIRNAALVITASLLVAFTRDAIDPILLAVGLVILAVAMVRHRHLTLVVGGALAAIGLVGMVLSVAEDNQPVGYYHGQPDTISIYNAASIIEIQVMTNAAERSYFEHHGLPVDRQVVARTDQVVSELPLLLDRPLDTWIRQDFNRTYAGYIAHYPVQIASRYVHKLPAMLTAEDIYASHLRYLPSDTASAKVWGSEKLLDALIAAAVGVGLIGLRERRRLRKERLLAVLAAACAIIYIFEVWLLSGLELARLTTPASVTLRVALIALIVCTVDALLTPAGAQVVPDPDDDVLLQPF